MTNEEQQRLEALEKEVRDLKGQLLMKNYIKPWTPMNQFITIGLLKAFDTEDMNPRIAQCKAAINCLVNKSFCKDGVLSLISEEVTEARPLVEYILNFIAETRKKYTRINPVRGYERKDIEHSAGDIYDI
ncbi:hypothetical protein KYB31_15485 [Clostridium felsineum]|uniref:hypothetical protein n=1 Tax=Clostridium felsineum TaxID=36839 RepID=UPI00214D5565|nr:hypothetical protein [Clostridium felsineum]MCR3760379.1 hypothetical protein [Clostridium felsineum]